MISKLGSGIGSVAAQKQKRVRRLSPLLLIICHRFFSMKPFKELPFLNRALNQQYLARPAPHTTIISNYAGDAIRWQFRGRLKVSLGVGYIG